MDVFADSITEYSFGIWTRWLSDFPDDLTVRKDSYSVFRLASDVQENLLSSYLKIKQFEFKCSDIEKGVVSGHADYELLEGYWNYVYAAFKDKTFVGVVITKDT